MRVLAYIPDDGWIEQVIGVGKALGSSISVFVTGASLADNASKYFERVYLVETNAFELNIMREALQMVIEQYNPEIFIAPSTNKGRALAGTYMGLTGSSGISDVIAITREGNEVLVERLVYGGTAKAIIKATTPLSLSISPGYFKGEAVGVEGEIIRIDTFEDKVDMVFNPKKLSENDPSKAEIVVAAGRGIREERDLEMIKEIAKLLGGAWSVTRPLAADYGWTDTWIGISGIVVSPKYYIAVGISGQPHHMMGARNSKIIIAINKDPNAPIFEETDYGIVGDLYKVLPMLIEKLKER